MFFTFVITVCIIVVFVVGANIVNLYMKLLSLKSGTNLNIYKARMPTKHIKTDYVLDKVPLHFLILLLLHEDDRFFLHHGLNIPEIFQSFKRMLKTRRVKGGSSITQQAAKQMVLKRHFILARKFYELIAAVILELHFTKEEILSLYLQVACFGPRLYGIEPAARLFFQKTPAELSIAESSLLISLIPLPTTFHRILRNIGTDTFDYRLSYEKIICLLRTLRLIEECPNFSIHKDISRLIAKSQCPHPDKSQEVAMIKKTTETVYQIPALVQGMRSIYHAPLDPVAGAVTQDVYSLIYFFLDPFYVSQDSVLRTCAGTDGIRTLALAHAHRIVQLAEPKPISLTNNVFKKFLDEGEKAKLINAAEFLRKRHHLEPLLAELSTANINVLLVKGFDLALRYYPDPALRPFSDIDLWVDRKDFLKASELLRSKGFSPILMKKGTPIKDVSSQRMRLFARLESGVHFKNPHSQIEIDLHPIPSPRFSTLWESSVKVQLTDSATFQALHPRELFYYLAHHGRKHHWHKLIWSTDLYYFFKKFSLSELESLYAESIRDNWDCTFLTALAMVEVLFQYDFSNSLLAALRRFIDENPLIVVISARLDTLSLDTSWKQSLLNLYHQTLYEPSMVRKIGVVTRKVFLPTRQDLLCIDLPEQFSFLYYVIRPFRLTGRLIRLASAPKPAKQGL